MEQLVDDQPESPGLPSEQNKEIAAQIQSLWFDDSFQENASFAEVDNLDVFSVYYL